MSNISNEILRQVDIVDIIGNYISISKHGKDYVGLCPFHSDNNPSLHVSPEKQIYKCFSCNAGGNAITFVQNFKKISYREALIEVCHIAGIKVPDELAISRRQEEKDPNERFYSLMKDLCKFYNYQLSTEEGKNALEYLKERNITQEDITYFEIGYSNSDGQKTIDYLRRQGYADDEIHSCGVVSPGSKEMIDQQRGRIVFPIKDYKGRVVGFSGRRIIDDGSSKYINTTDTVIFHKTKVLYNYHNAATTAHRDGYCYIVEGFFDIIALHKSGFNSIVASMGTAFTDDHKDLLEKLNCEIRLFFDSDEPGQATTVKCIDSLVNRKLNIKVVKPMVGSKDIDEVLATQGKEKVQAIASNLQNIIEYQIDFYAKRTNFNNHESVKEYINKCIRVLASSNLDSIDLEVYINRIAKDSSISQKTIENEYFKILPQEEQYYPQFVDQYQEPALNLKKHLDRYQQADHQILKQMIDNPLNIELYKSRNFSLCTKTSRQLAALIVDSYNKGETINYATLINMSENKDITNLITELASESYPDEAIEQLFDIIIVEYPKKVELDDLLEQLKNSTDIKEQTELGLKIIKKKEEINKRN